MKKIILLVILAQNAIAGHPISDRLEGRRAGAHQGGVFGPHGANTLNQFEFARLRGADIIEMDLRVTRDGIAVVFHDETLRSSTNCRGKISEKLLSELARCRPHNTDDGIPTFAEVLDWANGRVVINAEFKDMAAIAPAMQEVSQRQAYSWVYFQTQNNKDKYFAARQLDSQIALLFRVDRDTDLDWVESLNDDALVIIEIEKPMRRAEVIDRIHRLGKKVSEDAFNYTWTKEIFKAECKKVFANNIDIAISNKVKSCVEQK